MSSRSRSEANNETPRPKSLLLGFIIAVSQFGCSDNSSRVSAASNKNAALTRDVPENLLRWRVITSTIDRSDSTVATLFGNDLAVEYVRSHSRQGYPADSMISLVTWTQREDPRWFGANIPNRIKSVEFATVGAQPNQPPSYSYESSEVGLSRSTVVYKYRVISSLSRSVTLSKPP
jgi:hypothetical protein